jgi:hypothetical protein
MSALFAIVNFKRVFDVAPAPELLTLAELSAGLTRFEVKVREGARLERDLGRIEDAWDDWQAGRTRAGPAFSALLAAQRKATAEGRDVRLAVEGALAKLRRGPKDKAKRELLRLWSPAWYVGARRGSENVVHLSCLVLDYDRGTTPTQGSAAWSEWFHIVHTTWSHTPDTPKFRLILPLAQPIPAVQWAPFWDWAFEHGERAFDVATRSPGATFALPALRAVDAPREAWVVDGPLLDPTALGYDAAPTPSADLRLIADSHFAPPPAPGRPGGDPAKRYLELSAAPRQPSEWDVDAAFEDLF